MGILSIEAARRRAGCRRDARVVSAGIVSRSHRPHDRRARRQGDGAAARGRSRARRRARCRRGRTWRSAACGSGARLLALAAVRTPRRNSPPVAAARPVEADAGVHVYVSICTAAGFRRRAVGRARFERQSLGLSARRHGKAAALQVRSELQADPRRSATT